MIVKGCINILLKWLLLLEIQEFSPEDTSCLEMWILYLHHRGGSYGSELLNFRKMAKYEEGREE